MSKSAATAIRKATRDKSLSSIAEDTGDLDYVPQSELGRLALAARKAYLASGGRPLNREEIEREVAERRGGTHLNDDR